MWPIKSPGCRSSRNLKPMKWDQCAASSSSSSSHSLKHTDLQINNHHLLCNRKLMMMMKMSLTHFQSLRKAQDTVSDSHSHSFIHSDHHNFPFHSSNKLNLHLCFRVCVFIPLQFVHHCICVLQRQLLSLTFFPVSLQHLLPFSTNVFCVNNPHSCCVCVEDHG